MNERQKLLYINGVYFFIIWFLGLLLSPYSAVGSIVTVICMFLCLMAVFASRRS